MLTEEEALGQIISAITPLPIVPVPLSQGLYRFSAKGYQGIIPLPGFDNSAMDGYAIAAADSESKHPLKVLEEQPAGKSKNLTLSPQTAIRIFTGAPIPQGADAVIMQEDVNLSSDGSHIVCNEPVVQGENIRLTGADLCVGQRLVKTGDRLTPARLAVLASQGMARVDVHDIPKIAIVTTGDELVIPGTPLASGQLYNSNQILLEGLIRNSGCPSPALHHLPDDLESSVKLFKELTARYDFLIISGGVSVGDHDHVKPALKALEISPKLWRVKVKPGKPLLYAKASREHGNHCHIFGLPGNPVSSFVTFLIFVRPAILKASGAPDTEWGLPEQAAILGQEVSNRGDRPHYIRGRFEKGVFSPAGLQQSHALFSLSQANALLRMQPDETLPSGASVSIQLLGH